MRGQPPYMLAKSAIADMKSAIYILLQSASEGGLRNSEIGRALGIYSWHVGHEGHICRTLFAMMEQDGVVTQSAGTKRWSLNPISSPEE